MSQSSGARPPRFLSVRGGTGTGGQGRIGVGGQRGMAADRGGGVV